MAITVEGSGVFANQIPAGLVLDDLPTVGDVIRHLELKSEPGMIILVNNKLASWASELKPGDVVHLIPAIGGGSSEHRPAQPF